MADHTSDDAAIARLLAADNPEQFYEYDYGAEEGQSDDDPDYGAKRRRGRPGKKKAAAAADLPAVVPVTFDAAAAFGPAAAAAAAPAAAAAAADPGAAAAAPPAMVVPGAAGAAPTVLSTEQLQLMLQQQALIAAMAAQAGGPIQGLQLAPPPGVSLEQAQLMGLPIMAMPVVAGAMPAAAALPPPAAAKPVARGGGGTSGDDEYTASGRRKRKDTGKTRQQSRSWTDDEERLFVEALHLYGRDWKRCAEHVGTRDHRAFTSHAQKHFIKLLLAGEEVPPEVAESGRGYTLSGKPLDPNSASARAYGLKPDLFARIAGTGTLVVGVHVTTLDMTEGPPTQIARTKSGKSLGGGGGAAGSKRQKRGGKSGPVASYGGSGGETEEEEDDEAFMASVVQGEVTRVQEQARKGAVIELDRNSWKEVLVGKSRPYSVIVIADAKELHSSSKLKLGQVVADFKLVAQTYAATHAGGPAAAVVFARMDFSKAKDLFGRLGVQALPYLARIPPGLAITEGGAITLPKQDVLSAAGYPWSAEAIAEFVGDRCGLAVGEIKRPQLISSRLMPVVGLGALAALGAVAYRLYHAPFMRHQALYALGALAVYWFSVSGGMFNIIRGVPLVGYDRRTNQAMIFMSGQGQLGAEGFIMGTLYTTVGLAVAALIILAPRVRDPKTQRWAAYGILGVGVVAFRFVTANHVWKTGMRTSWYLF